MLVNFLHVYLQIPRYKNFLCTMTYSFYSIKILPVHACSYNRSQSVQVAVLIRCKWIRCIAWWDLFVPHKGHSFISGASSGGMLMHLCQRILVYRWVWYGGFICPIMAHCVPLNRLNISQKYWVKINIQFCLISPADEVCITFLSPFLCDLWCDFACAMGVFAMSRIPNLMVYDAILAGGKHG